MSAHMSAGSLTSAIAGCAVLKFCRNVRVVGESGSAPMSVLGDGDSRLPCREIRQALSCQPGSCRADPQLGKTANRLLLLLKLLSKRHHKRLALHLMHM